MTSLELQQARTFEKQYMPYIPEKDRPMFHVTGGSVGSTIPMASPAIRGNTICFTNIIPTPPNGAPCTGGM